MENDENTTYGAGGGKNNVDTLNKGYMVLYEYVGKMLRKEGKIVVENVKN